MITYQVESLTEAKDEFHPLFVMHWDEITDYGEDIKLDVDYDSYATLEDAGVVHVVTARDDGKLIAYSIAMTSFHLHSCQHLMANNDAVYVHPHYRGIGVFSELIDFYDDYLLSIGVEVSYMHTKVAHNFGRLLAKKGYFELEHTHEKRLGR